MVSLTDLSWFENILSRDNSNFSLVVRECLFARCRLLLATGLTQTAASMGIGLTVGSVHVVTQLPLRLMTPFAVDSTVTAFDARAIYVEHRVARLSDEGVGVGERERRGERVREREGGRE